MYFRKKSYEELPMESTKVWSCEKNECSGWIRDNFAFEAVPTCGLCHSSMVQSMKLLPQLVNTNRDMKLLPKGVAIHKKS